MTVFGSMDGDACWGSNASCGVAFSAVLAERLPDQAMIEYSRRLDARFRGCIL